MLSKNPKSSPARIAAGLVGVSALTLAALGLTASGTQAAEQIKSRVEAATGVSLAQNAPPPPPAAPEAAPPDAPGAPHIERHIIRDTGKDGKKEHRVVIVRTGRDGVGEIPDIAEIEPMIPEIHSRNCGKGEGEGDGKGGPMVIHKNQDGKKQVTIICANRIEGMAASASRMTEWHRDMGMRQALAGLRMARRSIEAGTTMSAEEKRAALKGIDDAMREVEKQAAEKD